MENEDAIVQLKKHPAVQSLESAAEEAAEIVRSSEAGVHERAPGLPEVAAAPAASTEPPSIETATSAEPSATSDMPGVTEVSTTASSDLQTVQTTGEGAAPADVFAAATETVVPSPADGVAADKKAGNKTILRALSFLGSKKAKAKLAADTAVLHNPATQAEAVPPEEPAAEAPAPAVEGDSDAGAEDGDRAEVGAAAEVGAGAEVEADAVSLSIVPSDDGVTVNLTPVAGAPVVDDATTTPAETVLPAAAAEAALVSQADAAAPLGALAESTAGRPVAKAAEEPAARDVPKAAVFAATGDTAPVADETAKPATGASTDPAAGVEPVTTTTTTAAAVAVLGSDSTTAAEQAADAIASTATHIPGTPAAAGSPKLGVLRSFLSRKTTKIPAAPSDQPSPEAAATPDALPATGIAAAAAAVTVTAATAATTLVLASKDSAAATASAAVPAPAADTPAAAADEVSVLTGEAQTALDLPTAMSQVGAPVAAAASASGGADTAAVEVADTAAVQVTDTAAADAPAPAVVEVANGAAAVEADAVVQAAAFDIVADGVELAEADSAVEAAAEPAAAVDLPAADAPSVNASSGLQTEAGAAPTPDAGTTATSTEADPAAAVATSDTPPAVPVESPTAVEATELSFTTPAAAVPAVATSTAASNSKAVSLGSTEHAGLTPEGGAVPTTPEAISKPQAGSLFTCCMVEPKTTTMVGDVAPGAPAPPATQATPPATAPSEAPKAATPKKGIAAFFRSIAGACSFPKVDPTELQPGPQPAVLVGPPADAAPLAQAPAIAYPEAVDGAPAAAPGDLGAGSNNAAEAVGEVADAAAAKVAVAVEVTDVATVVDTTAVPTAAGATTVSS